MIDLQVLHLALDPSLNSLLFISSLLAHDIIRTYSWTNSYSKWLYFQRRPKNVYYNAYLSPSPFLILELCTHKTTTHFNPYAATSQFSSKL